MNQYNLFDPIRSERLKSEGMAKAADNDYLELARDIAEDLARHGPVCADDVMKVMSQHGIDSLGPAT